MNLKFIAGLVIGAAIVHFFSTEEGMALIRRFKKDVSRIEDDLAEIKDNLIDKGRSLIGDIDEAKDETVIVEVDGM